MKYLPLLFSLLLLSCQSTQPDNNENEPYRLNSELKDSGSFSGPGVRDGFFYRHRVRNDLGIPFEKDTSFTIKVIYTLESGEEPSRKIEINSKTSLGGNSQ